MTKKDKFYVTTPIYYVNGPAHLGGAYTTIAADVLARWNKIKGKDVFFLTGTDEHGKKIQEVAKKKGLEPKKFVDNIVKGWKKTFKLLNISNDNFIRTTDKEHVKEVKKMLKKLYDKDLIYKGTYEAYYCVGCEQYLTKKDLVEGKCPLHNREPELRKEEAYLFKLSKFQDKLLSLIKSDEYEILPKGRKKEIIKFIEGGLEDVSISRLKEKVSWGIELPFDKEHNAWVWPDAFWNYITGLKKKMRFWPPDIQLMAKDIIRVHATIWPALLLALDYELPKTLFVHGYFTVKGRKMSKSLGNVIDPIELTEKYGSDSVRYFLMRNIPFGKDGDVSVRALVDRHNNELADKLGNLVSRVTSLAEKYGIKKSENKLLKKLKLDKIEKLIEGYDFDKALNLIFEFVDKCNEYVQEKKPWESKDRKVLYELVDSIRVIGILLCPFIPETAEKISNLLSFDIMDGIDKSLGEKKIHKAEILFEKKEKINKQKKPKKIEGVKRMDNISFKEWQKLDLRVGKITKVEEIENADKLFKLEVDTGKKRTLVAGLKPFYKKKELEGKECIVLCNLEPKKLKGVESQGMILAAVSEDESKVRLIGPDKKIETGSKVR